MNHYMQIEVEIKTLLQTPENAEILRSALRARGGVQLEPFIEAQKNCYFICENPKDLANLIPFVKENVDEEKAKQFEELIGKAQKVSVRTRETDTALLLVIKASLNDHSSDNGTSRIEWEGNIKGMSLEELDQVLIDAGLSVQAKWSRERETFALDDVTVTVDKNAGYGYLAEFEKIVKDQNDVFSARKEIDELMAEFGLMELPQDRLERMFAHYNKNWMDYYGTDNIFNID